MKIISLTQPWASLWMAGPPIGKGIETRGWGTSYLGPIAVHAAKGFPEECRRLWFTEPFNGALVALGFTLPGMLPLGCILGVVELTGCLMMVDEPVTGAPAIARYISLAVPDERLTATERAFGDYRAGRRAWVTAPARRALAEPIPYRGGQGLRDVPDDVAARLAA